MWLQRFTYYLLLHRLQTIGLIFLSTFIPIFCVIGILIAALITLRKGIVEGALATIAATLPYLISFYFSGHPHTNVPIGIWAAVGVAVSSNLLTFVFAVMLYRRSSLSFVLQVAALMGVLVISVVHLIYPTVADWWGIQLQTYYNEAQSVTGLFKINLTPASNEARLEAINISKQYATGLMMAAILFNAMFQLMIARWWQSIVFHQGSLRRELVHIHLSRLAGMLFLLALVLSYLGNSVVLDIMPVLYALFGAAGLSLAHYLFGLSQGKATWAWLAALYIAIVFSLPMSMILIAIFALFDIGLDIRKRIKKI